MAKQSSPDAAERSQEPAGDDPSTHPLSELFGGGNAPEDARRFPLHSFREARMDLRRPFSAEAVKWKVQAQFGEKGALVVGYIDVRLVIERLNLVLAELWHDVYVPVDKGTLRCDLTVDGIVRSDVGQGAGKTAYSDALKRAAVKFGVGVSLYAIPRAELWLDNHGSFITLTKRTNNKKQRIIELTAAGEEKLRERYVKWLDEVGGPRFGQPLEHGDVADAVGDVDVDAAAELDTPGEEQPIAALVEGEEADRLRDRAQELYVGITEVVGAPAYPPAQFRAGLESYGDSLDRLEEFVGQLEERLAEAREARVAS